MSNDYNDVGKLLDHMDLSGFTYRSFRKGEEAEAPPAPAAPAADAKAAEPAAAQVQSAPTPTPIAPAPAAPVEAPAAVAVAEIRPAIATPPVAPKLRVVRTAGLPAAAPAEISAAPSPAASGDARIGATLDRLMRGSITDSAPKLHLHLELPTRPTLDSEPAPLASGEQNLDEVFRKLHSAVAVKPRVVSGKER